MSESTFAAVGCTCLGLFIGVLVRIFVAQAELSRRFDLAALTGAISVLAGAGVLAVFHFVNGNNPIPEYWWYPIGLFFGFMGGTTVIGRISGWNFFGLEVPKVDGTRAGDPMVDEAWAALRMIREAIEAAGLIGVLPSEEAVNQFHGLGYLEEAEALVEGVRKLAARRSP